MVVVMEKRQRAATKTSRVLFQAKNGNTDTFGREQIQPNASGLM
jgi:hypothetical protein